MRPPRVKKAPAGTSVPVDSSPYGHCFVTILHGKVYEYEGARQILATPDVLSKPWAAVVERFLPELADLAQRAESPSLSLGMCPYRQEIAERVLGDRQIWLKHPAGTDVIDLGVSWQAPPLESPVILSAERLLRRMHAAMLVAMNDSEVNDDRE